MTGTVKTYSYMTGTVIDVQHTYQSVTHEMYASWFPRTACHQLTAGRAHQVDR
jgi:hypothetical protein